MKAKVIEESGNPVLQRRELLIEVTHDKTGTPERMTLKKFLASQFDEKPENLYLIKVESKTGSDRSLCNVEIYEEKDLAEKTLAKHIITRNLPPEERKPKKEREAKPREEKKAPEEKKEKTPEKTQPKEAERTKETEKKK